MQSNQQQNQTQMKDHLFHIGTGESKLVTLTTENSVLDAIQMMRDNNIGDVIVTEEADGEQMPVGILTDRDLAINVMAQCANPETLKVGAVMNKYLVTCPMNAGVFEMIRMMRSEGLTRLPIVSETGALKGIVNAKHLIQLLVQGLHDLSHISVQQKETEIKMQH